MNKQGFTLIELLIVLAITGFLATFTVVQLQNAREKSRVAAARTDIMQIIKLIQVAEQETASPLGLITGNYCSDCICRTAGDLKKTSGPCFLAWQDSINRIKTASNRSIGSSDEGLLRDPWGSPYALDENEREGSPSNCTMDVIRSVGPDGLYNTADDVNLGEPGLNSTIPWSKKCP